MKKPADTAADDIAKQSYQGPNAISAAAGEGFIAHFQWAGIGLAIGSLATWALGTHAITHVEKLRNYAHGLAEGGNTLVRGAGKLILGVFGHGETALLSDRAIHHSTAEHRQGFGRALLNHTIGLFPGGKEFVERRLSSPRLSMAITGGGIFAFFGYAILPILLSFKGAARGTRGKQQFEQAKDEIWDLRAENDQLREKNITLKSRLTDCETTHAAETNRLRVSSDQPVVREAEGDIPVSQPSEFPETPTKIDEPKIGPEKVEYKETPTKIDEPKIGPANTTGRVLDKAADWGSRVEAQKSAEQARDTTLA